VHGQVRIFAGSMRRRVCRPAPSGGRRSYAGGPREASRRRCGATAAVAAPRMPERSRRRRRSRRIAVGPVGPRAELGWNWEPTIQMCPRISKISRASRRREAAGDEARFLELFAYSL